MVLENLLFSTLLTCFLGKVKIVKQIFWNFNCNFGELKNKISHRISELKHRASGLEQNLETFYRKVCPAFRKVIKQLEDKKFDTSAVNGQIIYKSPWGYCYVYSVTKTNDFTLIRPGFLWDDAKSDYMKHSPDEIYLPLKLQSFICTDLWQHPTHLVAHLQFFQTHKATKKTAKELPSQRTKTQQRTANQRPKRRAKA